MLNNRQNSKSFTGMRMVALLNLFFIFIMGTAQATPKAKPQVKPVKILLIQGANMNYLGQREPEHYGSTTAAQLDSMVLEHARKNGYEVEIFYTNHEGDAIDKIYESVEQGIAGVVMNPGGFTYNGYSLRDCLIAVPVPYVEVHMLPERDWTGDAITSPAADLKIVGLGIQSYFVGMDAIVNYAIPSYAAEHKKK